MSDDHIHADRLYAPAELAKLEGCCIALIYRRLSAREYPGVVKDGRSTRIPGAAIIARRRNKLTPATFKAPPPPPPARFNTIRRKAAEARTP
jgi:hypothetical protein